MNHFDRVQIHTKEGINLRLRRKARERIDEAAEESSENVSRRIESLDREWDIERWLETNASSIALIGTVLGLTVNRKYLAIPCVVMAFLLLHALQGWCPPLPILRRCGVRTRGEIDEEKYALKALRGDFGMGQAENAKNRAEWAWQAATAR